MKIIIEALKSPKGMAVHAWDIRVPDCRIDAHLSRQSPKCGRDWALDIFDSQYKTAKHIDSHDIPSHSGYDPDWTLVFSTLLETPVPVRRKRRASGCRNLT